MFLFRPYDFSGHAILRCLHKCRYFFNVVDDEKAQLKLLQEAVQKLLDKNSARGLEGKAPMTYAECLEVARSVTISNGYSEMGLFQGCPYSGSRKLGAGGSTKEIADLKTQVSTVTKEMNTMKQQQQRPMTRGNNNNNRRGRGRGNNNYNNYNNNNNNGNNNRGNGMSAKQKVALSQKLLDTCQTYNLTGLDCKDQCTKRHACNFQRPDGFLCWQPHPAINHK